MLGTGPGRLDAKVLGCVIHVGPRPEEIICSPSKHDIWEKSVQDSAQDHRRISHAESDRLLMAILDPPRTLLMTSAY